MQHHRHHLRLVLELGQGQMQALHRALQLQAARRARPALLLPRLQLPLPLSPARALRQLSLRQLLRRSRTLMPSPTVAPVRVLVLKSKGVAAAVRQQAAVLPAAVVPAQCRLSARQSSRRPSLQARSQERERLALQPRLST